MWSYSPFFFFKSHNFASELSHFNMETMRHSKPGATWGHCFSEWVCTQKKITAFSRMQPTCIQVGFNATPGKSTKSVWWSVQSFYWKYLWAKLHGSYVILYFLKHLLLIANSYTSQEDSICCTEVISLTNRNGLLHGLLLAVLDPILCRSTKTCKKRSVRQSKTRQQR